MITSSCLLDMVWYTSLNVTQRSVGCDDGQEIEYLWYQGHLIFITLALEQQGLLNHAGLAKGRSRGILFSRWRKSEFIILYVMFLSRLKRVWTAVFFQSCSLNPWTRPGHSAKFLACNTTYFPGWLSYSVSNDSTLTTLELPSLPVMFSISMHDSLCFELAFISATRLSCH